MLFRRSSVVVSIAIALNALSASEPDLFHDENARAVVLVFVRTDCPISNRYAPELQRIYREFSARGVRFWIVYPDPADSSDSARKHAAEYGLPGGQLLDPQHALVHLAHAKITPEAAVFGPGKRLAYHGRIDNTYVSFGKTRSVPTTHELEAAIEAVLDGKAVPRAAGQAIGCSIADLQ